VAQWSAWNSVVQTVLKLTVPGVPDIYQGAESWDLSLVDPDNRRPVDYSGRAGQLAAARAADPGALLKHWHDGAVKLRIVADLLGLRGRHPCLFGQGSYEPVPATGPAADRICAYRRRQGEMEMIVVAALYPSRGGTGLDATTLGPAASDRDWTELFSARTLRALADLGASEILGDLPVAVLVAA
jgi:(1->4)-alpha-D-glucan 1-alpha-D-glucosylmutase